MLLADVVALPVDAILRGAKHLSRTVTTVVLQFGTVVDGLAATAAGEDARLPINGNVKFLNGAN